MCRYALYGSHELPDLCSGAGRILQASAHTCRQVDLSTWALLTGQGPVRGSSLVIAGCTGDGLSSIDESLVHTGLSATRVSFAFGPQFDLPRWADCSDVRRSAALR